jgi:hypothetical protein
LGVLLSDALHHLATEKSQRKQPTTRWQFCIVVFEFRINVICEWDMKKLFPVISNYIYWRNMKLQPNCILLNKRDLKETLKSQWKDRIRVWQATNTRTKTKTR